VSFNINVYDERADLPLALALAALALRFSRVERATLHEDGVRKETDADHVVMLGLLAAELVPRERGDLDPGLVALLIFVHDLPEAYAGDTNTLRISSEEQAAKRQREAAARERIAGELQSLGGFGVAELMGIYEAQIRPEARFVRLLDKIAPKLTHATNGCAAPKAMGMDLDELRALHRRQFDELLAEYPEFPTALNLLRAAMDHAEASWNAEKEG